jgi:HAD superfamily hydrolase (TIGR01509 family)
MIGHVNIPVRLVAVARLPQPVVAAQKAAFCGPRVAWRARGESAPPSGICPTAEALGDRRRANDRVRGIVAPGPRNRAPAAEHRMPRLPIMASMRVVMPERARRGTGGMQWAMIFDVDGVVADTEVLNARASVMMFRELYGTEVRAADFRPFVGTGDERYVEGVAEQYGVQIDTRAAVERRKDNFFTLLRDEPLPAMPGVIELVQAACRADDAKVAIATSGNKDKQFPVIEGTGLRLDWFDAVITGDDVTRKKPDPQIYLVTADRLGITPALCVVFEDAPAGVASARAAGMKCVALTSSVEAQKLEEAHLVVDSLAGISLDQMRGLAVS